MMDLQEIRMKIDENDDEILKHFLARMNLAAEVAQYKAEHNVPILNTAREREILSRVTEKSGDELDGYARILFSTMFSLSRSYQALRMSGETELAAQISAAKANADPVFPKKAVVACQGVEGAYSQKACDSMFEFASIMYFNNFAGVFSAVESGLCRYGVLPIENSAHGSVSEVYDLMQDHKFYIVKSMKLHVSHKLMTKKGVKLSEVREIFSHEQAIGQCSKFLDTLPDVRVTLCENTAMAAKMVAQSDRRDIAAISSADCAELYGLDVLRSSIHNTDNNYTRFIVISRQLEVYPGSNNISIMFAVKDRPGALAEVLSRFASAGINLTKLESRPVEGTDFEYIFYVDLQASINSPEVMKLLCTVEHELKLFTLLGVYMVQP